MAVSLDAFGRPRRALTVAVMGVLPASFAGIIAGQRSGNLSVALGFAATILGAGLAAGTLASKWLFEPEAGADLGSNAGGGARDSTPPKTSANPSPAPKDAPELPPPAPNPGSPSHEERMRVSDRRFRQLAESTGAVFWLSDARRSQIFYVSPGYERIWGRTCPGLYASPQEWFEAIHPEDRERVRAAALAGDYDEEFRIVRPDGGVRWIRDSAFAVRTEGGEIDHVAGVAEDITERKRLEKEVIEISDREQRRLGQDLHDGICQQLVSVAFATDLLRRDLVAKSPTDAMRLARITALLDTAILQARHLSHALYPVNLVGNGLGFALTELASSVSQGYHVDCEAQCSEAVHISDHALATHLYRIAQEAVQTAANHTESSRILISLSQEGRTICLTVSDNGVAANEETQAGVGLSIMRYRANMAGGRLEIKRGPLGGSLISVTVQTKDAAIAAPPGKPENSDKSAQPAAPAPAPAQPALDQIIACALEKEPTYFSTIKGEAQQIVDR